MFQEGFGELVVGGMTLQHRKLGELLGESWILDHGHLPVGRCVRHGWKQHPLKGAGKRPPPDGTMSSFSSVLRSSSRGRGQEAPKKNTGLVGDYEVDEVNIQIYRHTKIPSTTLLACIFNSLCFI